MSPSPGEYYINVDQSREQHQWRQSTREELPVYIIDRKYIANILLYDTQKKVKSAFVYRFHVNVFTFFGLNSIF